MNPNIAKRLDYTCLVLTVMAALPYELGTLATVIPPAWKPYVAFAGLVAKLILGEMKTQQAALQSPEKEDTKQP